MATMGNILAPDEKKVDTMEIDRLIYIMGDATGDLLRSFKLLEGYTIFM